MGPGVRPAPGRPLPPQPEPSSSLRMALHALLEPESRPTEGAQESRGRDLLPPQGELLEPHPTALLQWSMTHRSACL